MKTLILLIWVLIIVAVILVIMSIKNPQTVDADTREACKEYALRDHEKEIAPERYKWLGKEFVDAFDWYDSCINHVRFPVARENQ